MKRFLIVNADEFGLTEGVNEAIVDCHRNGIVTSTTLMANAWAFEEAVSRAAENAGLGVGIHVNLTFGSPVAPAGGVRSLMGRDGRLLPRPLLLRRWISSGLRMEEVETELRAQVEKVLAAGLKPSHLDSHQNTMMIPGVLKLFLKVAGEFGIPIRLPYEPPNFDGISSVLKNFATWRHAKKRLTSRLCDLGRSSLRECGVRTIDRIYSLPSCFMPPALGMCGRYEALISRIGPGVSELLTHPGWSDHRLEEFLGGSKTRAEDRERERAALVSERLKEAVRRHDIHLINYRELAGCPAKG